MTQLNPYYVSLDGLNLGTLAYSIETVRARRVIPPKRRTPLPVAFRHGTVPRFDAYSDERRWPLLITLFPTDESGDQDEDFGRVGQLEANLDDLFTVLAKRDDFIDVRQLIPVDDGSGEPLELQGDAICASYVELEGNDTIWGVQVELVFPYPYWHELPKIERSAATSHSIVTGGTAPIADMVLTLAGDGTVSLDGTAMFRIDGSSGPVVVDVGKREVTQGGELAMGLFRPTVNMPENWMEWPAQTAVSLTSTVNVAVDYYNARL